jgi:hypothetical protein
MAEIARLVPGYGGVSYARLERNGVNVPTASIADAGSPILAVGADGLAALAPALTPAISGRP